MSSLEGKRALVTGAASGIGRGIVEYFVAAGASVLLVDIDEEAVEQTSAEIGTGTRALACDVSIGSDVRHAVSVAVESFGGIDVMVNNAGISILAPLLDFDEDDFDRVIAVNLRGVFLGTKHGAAAIVASGGGAIVNIASEAGLRASPNSVAYAPSKAGVILLTQVAAVELRPFGVRANVVCPGSTDTPLFWSTSGAEARVASIEQRQGRMATPFDMAAAVAFLASDEASLITGVTLPVDGGRAIRMV